MASAPPQPRGAEGAGADTGKFHDVTSKVCEISVILHGETGLKNGILGRMYKKPGDFVAGFAAIAA